MGKPDITLQEKHFIYQLLEQEMWFIFVIVIIKYLQHFPRALGLKKQAAKLEWESGLEKELESTSLLFQLLFRQVGLLQVVPGEVMHVISLQLKEQHKNGYPMFAGIYFNVLII